ncbi:hypothetical protein A1Q1_04790 [Trichosporon asahii var. asahii CBS 2479]|uniref:Uncharacterized protein n=1 Tax=Trichosporon asahii var. asahii (strain ATCC 90039 / CBS 2479 / JCM 2466 / KCTC 7840 / NBRC 103889/ NCYC 2677 / UAMH 7654) TaxID=1186058 RepID=J5QCA3_TRIAS|nr:hypothetical protein A1Q1_04790 [Trichosporon asahii var. asahii CBS 2479]EJT46613.1 hypothetical protein A1Q1_04790 [Trichosporon asahii var. asahii CBS 2479]
MTLPYASYPDIVEDILRLSGRHTLLTARGTCSTLRDWVDRVLTGETLFFRSVGGQIVVSSQQGVWEPDLPPLRNWPSPTRTTSRSPSRSRESSRTRSPRRHRSPSPWRRYVPANPSAVDPPAPASPAEPDEERLPCFHPTGSPSARAKGVSRAKVIVLVDVPPSPGLDAVLSHAPGTAHIVILHAQHAPAPAYSIPKVSKLTMSVTPNCLCGARLGIKEVGKRWARRAPASLLPSDVEGVGGGAAWWKEGRVNGAKGGLNDGGGVTPELRHSAQTVHVRLTRLIADPILARASYSQLCAGLSGALGPETTELVLEQQGVMPEPFWNPACLIPLPPPSLSRALTPKPPPISPLSPSSPNFPLDPASSTDPPPALKLKRVEILARALPDFEVRSLVERLRARMRRTASQTEDHAELRRRFAAYLGLPIESVRARELPRCEWKRLHGQPAEPSGRCGHCAPLASGLEGILV